MQDNQSVAVDMPLDGRVCKAVIYFEDCPPLGGANAAVLGSHKVLEMMGRVVLEMRVLY